MRAVLKLPAYRRLLVAYTLNELAWPIGTVALAVLIYRRTGSAMGATAYFLAAQFVPALVSPLLVGRVDRLAARGVLPVLYAAEAVAFLLLGMLASPFSLVPVLLLTIADGVLALTARAISRATTVAITSPAGLLREGNALANATFSVCFLLGPAIGGVVVANGGTALALYLNSGLFAAVALTILTTHHLPLGEPLQQRALERLRAAIRIARERPRVRALLWVQGMAALVFSMSTPVEIVLVQHSLHLGASSYGVLVSAWGAGSLAGSAGYARWRNAPPRTLVCVAASMLALGFVLMAAAYSLWLVIVGASVAGVGNGVEVVAARTALQEEVEQEWMALIMSLNESVFTAAPGLGIVIGGGLATLAGPRLALFVAAGGSLVIVALAWRLLPRRGARVLLRPRPAREGISAEPDSHPKAAARR